jgi:dihydrofolate synthase/folylpolyglutamate synthase
MNHLEWLYSREKFGMNLGLDRIQSILEHLGNPQSSYRILHVAGTNGKGTVCHLLANILSADDYNTGLYISPHLQQFSERIVVNGNPISQKEIETLAESIRKIIETEDIPATFFEVVTAMALLHFKKKMLILPS